MPVAETDARVETDAHRESLVRDAVAEVLPQIALRDVKCGESQPYQLVSPEFVEAEDSNPDSKRTKLRTRIAGGIAAIGFTAYMLSGLATAEKAEAAVLPDGHSLVNPDTHLPTSDALTPKQTDIDLSKYTSGPPERMQTSYATPDANKVKGKSFRVMTYNILRAGKYFGELKLRMAKVAYMLKQKAEGAWGGPYARIQRAIGVIDAQEPQVIGLQEATPEQIGWLKTGLAKLGHRYQSFPKHKPVETSVLVDLDRFEVEKTQIIRNQTYGDKPGQRHGYMVAVTVRDKDTDQETVILNSHAQAHSTDAHDRGAAQPRLSTSVQRANFATSILRKNPDANYLDISDSNSTNMLRLVPDKYTPIVKDTWLVKKFGATVARTKLTYCQLTQKGKLKDPKEPLLQDALDEVRGSKFLGWCKDRSMNPLRHYTVDAVYSSKNLVVTKWQQIWSKLAMTASDHKPIVVDVYAQNDESQQP
jgi:endonuclease/exonuclease/phosphatase family metal-dependent hydrolase